MSARVTLLHEDARCLVVAKAPGWLSVPPPRGRSARKEPTVIDRLREDGIRALPVHRLDRETSGALLLARDVAARDLLMARFKAREVTKRYLAIVQGHPRPKEGELNFPIKDLGAHAVIAGDGRPARTIYRRVEDLGPAALVEIELPTGRHNQIRLHFAQIGHPLVGERKYARGREALVRHRRCALHASSLRFVPPDGDQPIEVVAPLPVDLINLRERLRSAPAPEMPARPARQSSESGPSRRRRRGPRSS